MLDRYRAVGAATAALAILMVATAGSTPAAAQRRGGDGAGIAAGVLGGLAAGAIVGGALNGPGYAAPAFDPGYAGDPYDDSGCGWVRQPVYDGVGRFAGYRTVPAC